MTLGERIRLALKSKNVKQKELADQIGIAAASVSQFCSGTHNPSARTIRDIARALNIREEWLRTGAGEMTVQTPDSVTDRLAQEYNLQPYAAQVVNAFAQAVKVLPEPQLKALINTLISEMQPESETPALIQLRRYSNPAAAGAPLWAESDYEMIDYPVDVVPSKADFAVIISGKSMMPTYPDGCTVFVRRTNEPSNGDVVIAWIDGEGTVCKRARVSCGRLIRLESDNPEYQSIEKQALENARIYGVVVGFAE